MIFDQAFTREGVTVVRPSDAIRTESVDELRAYLEGCLKKDAVHVVFDLSKVAFICSSGLGVLMELVSKFRRQEGNIVFAGLTGLAFKTFKTMQLQRIFSVFGTTQEAIEYFEKAQA